MHQVRSEFPLTLAFCNSKKNRYETCLTCSIVETTCCVVVFLNLFYLFLIDDHARVVLPFLEGMKNCDSDYINAAYIDVW